MARQTGPSLKIIHDILYQGAGGQRANADEDVERIYRDLSEYLRVDSETNTNNIVIGRHFENGWTHLHVLHGCATYEQTHACRCSGLRRAYKRLGSIGLGRRYGEAATEGNWRKLLFYLHKERHQVDEVRVGNSSYKRHENNQNHDVGSRRECGAASHSDYSSAFDVYLQHCRVANREAEGGHEKNTKRSKSRKQANKKVRRLRSAEELGEEVEKLIEEVLPFSFQNLIDYPSFPDLFPEFKYDAYQRDKICHEAYRYVKLRWNKMSGKQLLETLNNVPWALYGNGHQPYYSPSFSYQIMIRILFEQLKTEELVKEFLDNVVSVIDKKHEKRNTICIISPPSSGKTFIVDSLKTAMLNTGHIQNSSKQSPNRFAFQDAHRCRLAIWNEAVLCSQDMCQTAKMILEGAPTTIDRKFEKGTTMERTPIIITANNVPWRAFLEEDKAFKQRCFFYDRWQTQPWLIHLKYKLNPLLWYFVFNNSAKSSTWDEFPNKQEIIDTQDEHLFTRWLKQHHPDKM